MNFGVEHVISDSEKRSLSILSIWMGKPLRIVIMIPLVDLIVIR